MDRTALKNRELPDYTIGEERFHTVSHGVGAAFGIVALVLCVKVSLAGHDSWALAGSLIYGVSMILLYAMSGVYHGLRPGLAKKVMQVLDHCTIYFLIGGSYTPILFCAIRPISPVWAWTLFGVVWGLCVFATIFTAIDLKKYAKLSMACYIGMGWCIVIAIKIALQAIPWQGFLWLLGGGLVYTAGAMLYAIGKRRRYMHSVFHVFVLLGSVMQFVCIYVYVLP